MKRISAKDVRMGIKNGMTVQNFCAKYRCEEEELRSALGRLYSTDKGFSKVWNQILANEKIARKEKTSARSVSTELPTESSTELPSMFNVDEDASADVNCDPVPRPTQAQVLRALEEKIALASDNLIQKEVERKDLIARHREKIGEMKKISSHIEKLIANVSAEYKRFEVLSAECDENIAKQSEVWAEITSLKTQIEADRKTADRMRTIEICLFNDGHFESSSDEIDFSRIDISCFEKLLHHEKCENFTVAEIRNLSKLLKIAEESKFELIVTCDNSKLEEAFLYFRNESSLSLKNQLN